MRFMKRTIGRSLSFVVMMSNGRSARDRNEGAISEKNNTRYLVKRNHAPVDVVRDSGMRQRHGQIMACRATRLLLIVRGTICS